MSKKKKRNKKVKNGRQQESRVNTSLKDRLQYAKQLAGRILKSTWFYIGTLVTIIGLIEGYHFFDPRLSVSAATALNPLDPFSVPFVLSNDGNVSIHSVNYSCIFNFVESERGLTFNGAEIGDERYIRARLYPSEKDTFRCLFAGNFAPPRVYLPIRRADITVRILYRPSFRLSKQSQYFRFVTQRSTDNQLHWFQQSLE